MFVDNSRSEIAVSAWGTEIKGDSIGGDGDGRRSSGVACTTRHGIKSSFSADMSTTEYPFVSILLSSSATLFAAPGLYSTVKSYADRASFHRTTRGLPSVGEAENNHLRA